MPLIRRQSYGPYLFVAIAIFFTVFYLGAERTWSGEKINASLEIGNKIIDAIERHKVTHGTYPETLAQLVPDYLPSIISPSAGVKVWKYKSLESGNQFQLLFSKNDYDYPAWYYISDGTGWDYDR